MSWQERAVCRDMDPDLFFPGPGSSHDVAVAACRRCLVRADCLAAALALPGDQDRVGIRGGVGPTRRRELRGAS